MNNTSGSSKSLIRNTLYMAILQLWNYVIPLITFPYLARKLGVFQFGELNWATAIVAYFIIVTDWGFQLNASSQVAQARGDREKITQIFWNVVLAKAMLALGCLIGLSIAIAAVPSLARIATLLFACSLMVLANVGSTNWCLQGLERLGALALATSLGRLLTVPLTFVFVHSPGDVWIAALIQAGSMLMTMGVSIHLLVKTGLVDRPRCDPAGAWEQVRSGFSLFISQAAVSLYTTTNTVVLGLVAGPGAVGIFAVADKLRGAASGVMQPFSQAAYPRSHRLMAESREDGLRFTRRLLLIQGGVAALVSLVLFCAAPLIISLIAGSRYAAAVAVLRILSVVPFLVALSNVLGLHMMLPLGMKTAFSRILMASAVLNSILIVPLNWFFGAIGAATCTVASEIFVTGLMGIWLWRKNILHIGEISN